ncbi:MAG: DUF512 domain-containing protein [Roseburia sp.]|nr:DUF512 domain-containing protein [Roseburia sp.]
MEKEHVICQVEPGSIAEEMEIEPGDVLLAINDTQMEDIFDYHYLCNDEYIVVLIRKKDGEEWELEIEKEYNEDLGIVFENGLMDEYRSCSNKCMFCFIDQMPKGMRDTLYFKDDDSRLSFLQGNYITLTNMKQKDLDRIIRYHLEPINVSVHTMNPGLRCKMLNNRFAGDALSKLDCLYQGGVMMNGQIVLCKGVNDGGELEYTIEKLTEYIPNMQSLSVVPVGLTKYRDGLYPLEPFEKKDAIEVLGIIHKWQQYCMERYGIHFVQAGDEWYLLAEMEIPSEETYDGYLQLENGVGMMRLLENEFVEELKVLEGDDRRRKVSIATGLLAAPLLTRLGKELCEKFPGIALEVIPIRNEFFGEKITVSGLLTGQDILAQLKGRNLGDVLLLSNAMLKSGEEVFLDDMTVEELKNSLQVPLDIVKSSGQDLIRAILGDSLL